MAVLFVINDGPVNSFFGSTPPRRVIVCKDLEEAIATLLNRACKYVLARTDLLESLPDGVEIRTSRGAYSLLQRRGQITRSDRCRERVRRSGMRSWDSWAGF